MISCSYCGLGALTETQIKACVRPKCPQKTIPILPGLHVVPPKLFTEARVLNLCARIVDLEEQNEKLKAKILKMTSLNGPG